MKKVLKVEKRIYKIEDGVEVPDGTMVFPIIGPRQQQMANIPIYDDLSLAYGELELGEKSSVHIHPVCAHLTYVLSGKLTVQMKDSDHPDSYTLDVDANEAVLTKPGTFFQLINRGQMTCRVIYYCTPGFVFELDANGNVVYNDAIVLPYTWKELKERNWYIPEMDDLEGIKKRRQEALDRMNNSL